MRFDPTLTREETLGALIESARATWGEERLAELRTALEITAGAIWLVAQERVELTDLDPRGGVR